MKIHPLTDEAIHREFLFKCCYCEDDLRSAADWQLEQVLKWIKNCRDYDLFHIKDRALMRRELKKAMRPTQEDK